MLQTLFFEEGLVCKGRGPHKDIHTPDLLDRRDVCTT